MSRHTYLSQELERQAFAERAARHFQSNPTHYSYTDGELAPEALLALRWGMGMDCVHVMRIGHDELVIYGQLITTVDGVAP